MEFVDHIEDLEFYNAPTPQWGCYSDPVFAPNDILLQANGFDGSTGIIMKVYVYTPDGLTNLEDATTYFDWFLSSFNIAGTTYYFVNLRCNSYSPAMLNNKCFILRVLIPNDANTVVLFDKYTQKYEIVNTSVVYASGVGVTTDGETIQSLTECVPGPDAVSCGERFVKFESKFDCIDKYAGEFYDEGSPMDGSGVFPFPFIRSSWLRGKLKKIPNAIKRTISINCRTQKTEVTPKYQLLGNVVFPVWKVTEIENMLLANHLYVDGVEYQSEGGTPFEQVSRPFNCQYVYKLALELQKCFQWQIFGCVPSCAALATYYGVPRPFSRVYDDSERLVATDAPTLKTYFESLPGSTVASELPFAVQCQMDTIMKVTGTSILPKYLYIDTLSPATRVFARQADANTSNLDFLCNGATNNNQVPVPDVEGGENISIDVPIPDVQGGENQDYNVDIVQIQAAAPWTQNTNYNSAINSFGEVTLNLSIFASSGDILVPLSGATIGRIGEIGRPETDRVIYGNSNPNLLPDSVLQITSEGYLIYTGDISFVDEFFDLTYLEFFNVRFNKYGNS